MSVTFTVSPCTEGIFYPTTMTLTATDTTPAISGVNAYSWQLNNTVIGLINPVLYTFTAPFTGNLTLTVAGTGFSGTETSSATYLSFGNRLETVLPTGQRGSTTLNPIITSYDLLKWRIINRLGYPMINVEVCDDVIYDIINEAIEWYTKYAGYTEEYLVFNSQLYTQGKGIRLDTLFSVTPELRSTAIDGISACFDYDLNDYRKVSNVFSVKPGETTGINTLFTLEHAMAQQTYFSYMLGNAGFDLITWEVLKGWLDLREKVLAQTPYFRFDKRTQILRIIPEPGSQENYLGVIGCYVEEPIRNLVRERWVQRYALALLKITLGTIRGKYQGMALFGGGNVNYQDLIQQGTTEKEKLEEEIMYKFGEVTPPVFYLG